MSLIPDPPLDDAGALRVGYWHIAVHLAWGSVSGCVMCLDSTWDWWDLSLCDMPPVTDRYGQLTDQVPLHKRCIPALLIEWASILGEDSGGAAPVDTPDDQVQPTAGVRSTRERPRAGAYAR